MDRLYCVTPAYFEDESQRRVAAVPHARAEWVDRHVVEGSHEEVREGGDGAVAEQVEGVLQEDLVSGDYCMDPDVELRDGHHRDEYQGEAAAFRDHLSLSPELELFQVLVCHFELPHQQERDDRHADHGSVHDELQPEVVVRVVRHSIIQFCPAALFCHWIESNWSL